MFPETLIIFGSGKQLLKNFNSPMILKKFARIKVVVLDVDGVLTNGEVLVTESGEQLRQFFVKDGYAMQLAIKTDVPIWVISGGKSESVRSRLEGLGLREIHIGVSNKRKVLQELVDRHRIDWQDLLYVGDDIPDYDVMKDVGVAACPVDAAEEIKAISHYVSSFAGGRGVVRDVLEKVLKLQGKWAVATTIKSV